MVDNVKKIFIQRHSYAAKYSPDGDFNRQLTDEGKARLITLAQCMENKNFTTDIVYCSPSVRTKETYNFLQERLEIDCESLFPEQLYNADLEDIKQIIEQIPSKFNSAWIIGHNPTISAAANYLTNNSDSLLNFTPGNIASIRFDSNDWSNLGVGKLEWLS